MLQRNRRQKTIILYLNILSVFKTLINGKLVTHLWNVWLSHWIPEFLQGFPPYWWPFHSYGDRITRIFNDSGANWTDVIYQRCLIKNRVKNWWWSPFTKIVNNFSLFPTNIHLLSVLHWQFLITYTFSVSFDVNIKSLISGANLQ